jgi:hypothetical protein
MCVYIYIYIYIPAGFISFITQLLLAIVVTGPNPPDVLVSQTFYPFVTDKQSLPARLSSLSLVRLTTVAGLPQSFTALLCVPAPVCRNCTARSSAQSCSPALY